MFLLVIAYSLPIAALVVMFLLLLQGSSSKRRVAISFRIFLLVLIAWLGLLWVTDQFNDPSISLMTLRLALMLGSFAPAAFFLFTELFSGKVNRRLMTLFLSASVVFGIISLTPFMVSSVAQGRVGIVIPQQSFIYTLQTLYTVVVFGYSFYWMRQKVRRLKDPIQMMQTRLIGFGLIIALICGVAGSYILHNQGTNLLLPLGVAAFSGAIFMAIFRHGLFDVRFIVARSVAYLLSLFTLGAAFSVIAIVATGLLFHDTASENSALRWVYTVLALGLALIFPSLKYFFDKLTDRIFFQDSYDTQAFLERFNRILVSTYDIQPLLRKSALEIANTMKPLFAVYGIRESDKADIKTVGVANGPMPKPADMRVVQELMEQAKRKIIIVDHLESKYDKLRTALQYNNVAVICRLTSNQNSQQIIGYLVLGAKKSGNAYSSRDINVIEIVTNELMIAIQNALRTLEIENFNQTLQEKIAEATRKLRRTNEKLKALDEAKDDFVSMASHQLRTPLTSVKGYISMVLEGDAGKINATQRKLLEQSFISSQRMVYLIADLLNVSRLKTGKFVIESSPVNLAELVGQEIGQLQETAAGRQLTLNYAKPDSFPTLMLDETKTRQVIMNFVDNAIYYTPAGGSITVQLRETPASVECRVIDTGIGVPKHEQPHLFTKFYRAANARTARPDGTGLGLFMAKKVVTAEGGAIIFETEEGKGSTFGFTFPKSSLEVKAPTAPRPTTAKA